jgi:hypothetical protein
LKIDLDPSKKNNAGQIPLLSLIDARSANITVVNQRLY